MKIQLDFLFSDLIEKKNISQCFVSISVLTSNP